MALDMASFTPSRQRWTVLSGLFLVYMASNGITLHTLPLLYPELMETFKRVAEVNHQPQQLLTVPVRTLIDHLA